MEGPEYLDYIEPAQAKTKSKKKRKVTNPSLQVGEGSTQVRAPAAVEGPPHMDLTTPPPSPIRPSNVGAGALSNAVFLEPGELWHKGLTKSLMAAVKPPKMSVSPVTSEKLAALRRHQEEAMKTASLMDSFAELLICHDQTLASSSSLQLKVGELEKEKEVLGSRITGLETQVSELTPLKEKVKELEEKVKDLDAQLGVAESSSAVALQEKSALEATLKVRDEELVKTRELLRKGVIQAFDNATAQAKVLNPGMVTEGMLFNHVVVDGKIVPYRRQGSNPDPVEEESGDEDEEEEEESPEVAVTDTPAIEAS